MERCPAIMLMIDAGTTNGEILRGLLFRFCVRVVLGFDGPPRPPMLAPTRAPQRSGSSFGKIHARVDHGPSYRRRRHST